VRLVAYHRQDPLDLALAVENDARLVALEVQGAALLARRAQHLVELVQAPHRLQHVGMVQRDLPAELAVRLFQQGTDLGVGEPRLRVHHALVELVAGDTSRRRDVHVADHAQPVHVRIQRTQAVGQHLRQHGHDLLRKIHGIAALQRLLVQCGARAHIMRNVGDGHDQAEAAATLFAKHGVVEVARILAVYGHQRQRAQVGAALLVGLLHLRIDVRRLFLHRIRPDMRNLEIADRNVDFHARGEIVAQHLGDAAAGERAVAGIFKHLDGDELSVGRHKLTAGDQDFLGHPGIVGHDIGVAGLHVIAADEMAGVLLHDADDLAFAPPLVVVAGLAHEHDVAMEDPAHLARGQQQVGRAVVGDQEAETVGMAADPAPDERRLGQRTVGPAPVHLHLAIAQHGPQAALQCLRALFLEQAEVRSHLLCRQRLARLF
jgi:hypothetical protein